MAPITRAGLRGATAHSCRARSSAHLVRLPLRAHHRLLPGRPRRRPRPGLRHRTRLPRRLLPGRRHPPGPPLPRDHRGRARRGRSDARRRRADADVPRRPRRRRGGRRRARRVLRRHPARRHDGRRLRPARPALEGRDRGRGGRRSAGSRSRWSSTSNAAAVAPFDAYERRVLPLLARHGGRLDRRLRTADGRTEIHLLSFADRAGYDAYVADPDRADAGRLLDGIEIRRRLLEVTEVDPI